MQLIELTVIRSYDTLLSIEHGLGHKKDVVFYKDADCKTFFGRWTWAHTPPRKNIKTVTLNCFQWSIE